MKAVLLSLLLTACASQHPPTCTPESLSALRTLYSHAARDIIESGACDAVERVENCAPYKTLELHFELVAKGLCE